MSRVSSRVFTQSMSQSRGKDMGGCCVSGGKDQFCTDDDECSHPGGGGRAGGESCSIVPLFYSKKSICEFFIL